MHLYKQHTTHSFSTPPPKWLCIYDCRCRNCSDDSTIYFNLLFVRVLAWSYMQKTTFCCMGFDDFLGYLLLNCNVWLYVCKSLLREGQGSYKLHINFSIWVRNDFGYIKLFRFRLIRFTFIFTTCRSWQDTHHSWFVWKFCF